MNAINPFICDTDGLPQVEEILALLRHRFSRAGQSEDVKLPLASGRILAHSVQARLTVPPCDRSAMDGYAFRFDDTRRLKLAGTALAGKPHTGAVRPGECVAIATGGCLPEGCDTVAMREHCEITPDGILVTAKMRGSHIRRRGEDFKAGNVLLPAGTRLSPRPIGLLAAAGVESVAVRRPLTIALLSIGDELDESANGGIADANRPLLQSLCAAQGFAVTDLGILPDSRARMSGTLALAAATHDVVLTTAGTSAGDEDHMRGAMMDCGGQLLFAGAAIKPGKPVSFGAIGRTAIIALPGNPAAAYTAFLALGLPLLHHLSGASASPAPWQDIAAHFTYRKKAGAREYLRVRLIRRTDGALCAERCGDGSAMLASLAASDGLVMLSEDVTEVRQGDILSFATFQALESP